MPLNNVTIGGRLVAPIELRNGNSVWGTFSVAVDSFKKDDPSSFIDCKAFGKTAEFIDKNIKKGEKFVLMGSMQQERWEKDGQKRSRIVVSVGSVDKFQWDEKPADTQPAADPKW